VLLSFCYVVIGADSVVRWRQCCDEFVTVFVSVGGSVGVVSTIQRKTPDQNDLKLGTVVVLDRH